MRTQVVLAAAAALLSACVSSGGADTIVALPSEVSSQAFVQTVALIGTPADVGAEFKPLFESRVAAKMKTCARGSSRPLRLEVNLTEFRRANAAATMLVGSSNAIRGSAKLLDAGTGAVVGDYDINRSVGGGGLIAVAGMAQAQEQMSDAFAEELCKRAFVSR